MLNSKESVYVAQIAIFAMLNLPAFFVMFKHGLANLHGWLFVWTFACVRIVGAALLLQADMNGSISEAGTIIYNVALAPLVFAISGITLEASVSVAHRHPNLLGNRTMLVIHGLVVAAIALVIVGAVNITSSAQSGEPISNSSIQIVQGGVSLFLVIVFAVSAIAFYSFRQPRSSVNEKRLITAVVVCTPLLVMRILYSFLGAVINNSSWSFLTGGTLAEQVVLAVVPELIIVIILVGVGFITRNLPKEQQIITKPEATRHV